MGGQRSQRRQALNLFGSAATSSNPTPNEVSAGGRVGMVKSRGVEFLFCRPARQAGSVRNGPSERKMLEEQFPPKSTGYYYTKGWKKPPKKEKQSAPPPLPPPMPSKETISAKAIHKRASLGEVLEDWEVEIDLERLKFCKSVLEKFDKSIKAGGEATVEFQQRNKKLRQEVLKAFSKQQVLKFRQISTGFREQMSAYLKLCADDKKSQENPAEVYMNEATTLFIHVENGASMFAELLVLLPDADSSEGVIKALQNVETNKGTPQASPKRAPAQAPSSTDKKKEKQKEKQKAKDKKPDFDAAKSTSKSSGAKADEKTTENKVDLPEDDSVDYGYSKDFATALVAVGSTCCEWQESSIRTLPSGRVQALRSSTNAIEKPQDLSTVFHELFVSELPAGVADKAKSMYPGFMLAKASGQISWRRWVYKTKELLNSLTKNERTIILGFAGLAKERVKQLLAPTPAMPPARDSSPDHVAEVPQPATPPPVDLGDFPTLGGEGAQGGTGVSEAWRAGGGTRVQAMELRNHQEEHFPTLGMSSAINASLNDNWTAPSAASSKKSMTSSKQSAPSRPPKKSPGELFPDLPSAAPTRAKHIKGVGSLPPGAPAHIFSRPSDAAKTARQVIKGTTASKTSAGSAYPGASGDAYSVGTWACSACTFQNDNSLAECSVCGTPKEPKGSPTAGGGGGKKKKNKGRKVDLNALLG